MSTPSIQPDVPAIEMAGVTIGRSDDLDASVVEDVDWKVAPGEYWVIGGMHNSGKSALLATVAGLTPVQKGTYRLFGRRLPDDLAKGERRRVGLVFDGGRPFHRLSVAENVALPLLYHHVAGDSDIAERARAILELTGLSSRAGRMPGTIGRAWEKRLGLARALALQPDVLLLDDPLGGLDSRHTNWWMTFLDELSSGHPLLGKRPMTLAVAAHRLQPWRNRAVCLAFLQHKRFVALGRCSELASVTEPLVRDLLLEEATEAS
jgi:ABC-type transporter Mla maintaining outer membrane lipid asymmetry ATPase subunit MlaF